jgi:deoxyribodipyrimidine photo-lyase
VRQADAPQEDKDSLFNEMIVWRELALNFCVRNAHHASVKGLPAWARTTLRTHATDPRPHTYALRQLERAETESDLWNAAQRELVQTGTMHNYMRMLWGKSVLLWTRRVVDALAWMIELNDKYALDGRDPNSYAGMQWCLGKFDRPFAERPVLGMVRPMSLERARRKFDAGRYIQRWAAKAHSPDAQGEFSPSDRS